MTYCVGIKLKAGLVFLSDSRTNAGVDHISTFRKMIVYARHFNNALVWQHSTSVGINDCFGLFMNFF